ncbi:head GIN domain-containing protein [Dysgonomonas sp. Marseille-P4361]|uniref:head GIN domain-containing protein n=1 Tax=Dysgonomonas sp. Marseille-P4361 TaxID=2161820 RepID=UPI00135C435A|nr:head GIN domain-containing protein [Dysgonomonas sp. Marseille-P4361]
MKTKIFIICTLVASIMGSCSTSAQTNKGKYNVENFTKIDASSGIDIYYTQGNKHYVEVDANEDILKDISVTVKNGLLEIKRIKNNMFKKGSPIKAYITSKDLQAIDLSGGVDFYAKEIKTKNSFKIAASGGADIEITKIKADESSISISGGADCDISELDVQTLNITTSGGSDAEINVRDADRINASASGGSDLTLSGKTKDINVKASGGADAYISNLSYQTIDSKKSGGGSINK